MNRILCLAILLLFPACVFSQPQSFEMRPLEGYYLDAKIPLKKGLNFFVISDQKTFTKYFGNIHKADAPRFDFEHVLVMAMPDTKKQMILEIAPNAVKAGNYIEVYCSAKKKNKHTLTYFDHPIVVIAIPKYFSVNEINFYDKEELKLLESIHFRK